MTEKQPEALQLANALNELDAQFSFPGLCGDAATELRRLHELHVLYQDKVQRLELENFSWRTKLGVSGYENQFADMLDEIQRLRAELKFNTVEREWVGLTDEEIDAVLDGPANAAYLVCSKREQIRFFVRAIEAKLREKNAAQPAPVQDDIPKIGCVNHDCDKCKAQPAPVQEPDAYLHDDGCWTAAKTYAGRQLNDRLLFAGSPKIGVYTTPPAAPTVQEPEAWMFNQAKYGPKDLRGQQWRPALSWSKPYTENGMVRDLKPLYPPAAQPAAWVGLTDEEVMNCYLFWVVDLHDIIGFYKGIETKLREKNAA